MSSLVRLVEEGLLVRLDPALGPGVLEVRRLYMLPRVIRQIEERVRGTASDRHLETEPEAQMDGLLADFCEGIELDTGTQFKCLRPVAEGVWELKTSDLRLFGWFHARDCFIWCAVAAKWKLLETPGLVFGYVREAARIREELFGQDAQFVRGESPDDVISNWC